MTENTQLRRGFADMRKLLFPTVLSLIMMAPGLVLSVPSETRAQESLSLSYRVSWNSIPAASAKINFEDQQEKVLLSADIGTNRFVDLLWKMRGRAFAAVEKESLLAERFIFDRTIRGKHELTTVLRHPDGMLTGDRVRPGRVTETMEIDGLRSLDPVSAVLRATRKAPTEGEPSVYDVFTGEAHYRFQFDYAGHEHIRVAAGNMDVIRINPKIWRLDRNQPDDRVKGLTIWVAREAPHYPVRVRSEVFIGAVYCDLTEISRPSS